MQPKYLKIAQNSNNDGIKAENTDKNGKVLLK